MLSLRTPLAWRNLTHKKGAMLVSASSVSFAVLIMFMQLGFLNGLYDSQTALIKALRADLVLLSHGRHIVIAKDSFPRSCLARAAAHPQVSAARPLYLEDGNTLLRNPHTGIQNALRVIACDVDDPIFEAPEINAQLEALRPLNTVLVDTGSRRFFGFPPPGEQVELAGRRVTVAGEFRLGSDFYYDGNAITSDDTLRTLFPYRDPEQVQLGLLTLRPGARPLEVAADLRRELPELDVLTRERLATREEEVWGQATPAGYVFGLGVVVGFIIGVVITYQILYTDVVDHLPQLATLKAMGYRDRDMVRVVLTQALLLGLLGFVPGLGLSAALYHILHQATGILMFLTPGRVLLILGLTAGMCVLSGLFALRRVLKADPAELY